MRKFFLWTVPSVYYPIGLLFLFSFLDGFSLAHVISISLGYGFGYGYLDRFRISASRCKVWEETYLQSFVGQDANFIVSSIALGNGAWSNDVFTQSGRNQNGLHDFISRWSSPTEQQLPSPSDIESNDFDRTRASRPKRSTKSYPLGQYVNDGGVFTSSSSNCMGQQLGGASPMQNQDP